jgi:hypothetical protein
MGIWLYRPSVHCWIGPHFYHPPFGDRVRSINPQPTLVTHPTHFLAFLQPAVDNLCTLSDTSPVATIVDGSIGITPNTNHTQNLWITYRTKGRCFADGTALLLIHGGNGDNLFIAALLSIMINAAAICRLRSVICAWIKSIRLSIAIAGTAATRQSGLHS